MRRKKRRFPVGIVILIPVLIVLAVVMAILIKKRQEPVQVVYEENAKKNQTIQWQGTEYQYNDHLSNYLFIGVDEYEWVKSEMGELEAGQCDALFLLSYDRVTKGMTVISIPRDTMTDIEVFLPDGTSGGISRDHISLSYGFGDGKHESCRLTKEAVSNLFYGLNINGYCAMSMSGLPVIPEVVGEFPMVLPNNSLEKSNPDYTEGSEVMVTVENAETLIRYRDVETTQSALHRQERQKAFLEAALTGVESRFSQDSGIVTDLYEALTPYLVTSMSNDLFLELVEAAYSGQEVITWTLPGEGVTGEVYDEYLVDDELLYEKIIETFYKKVEK